MGQLCLVIDLSLGVQRAKGEIVHIGQQGMRLVTDLHYQGHITAVVEPCFKATEFKVGRNVFNFIQIIEIYL